MDSFSSGLKTLFSEAVRSGASDIHADASGRIWLRMQGELRDGNPQLLAAGGHAAQQDLDRWVRQTLGDSSSDLDFSFILEGIARFRAHLYRVSGGWGAVFRAIPLSPPTLAELELPPIVSRIPQIQRGLVLVTGATGSGKSSTLAALIHEINRTRAAHIVTIEDPVEFVHQPLKSRISQREVGSDTPGFAQALRSALREDPDVILVGEMRDPETVSVALKAGETGHLVLSTVHTQDAVRTVGRLIALFPPEEQRLVRLRMADNLAAIVSQRLVARKGGGRIAAMEVALVNQSVRECIESGDRTDEMMQLVERGGNGQSFDRHLVELYLSGQITLDAARQSATRPADLERELKFGTEGRLALEDTSPVHEMEKDRSGSSGPDPFASLKLRKRSKN